MSVSNRSPHSASIFLAIEKQNDVCSFRDTWSYRSRFNVEQRALATHPARAESENGKWETHRERLGDEFLF
jgi:hypothetical protein